MILTYKYRLLPTKAQHAAMAAILEQQRQLYNAGLEERVGCYRCTGKTLSFFDQCRSLSAWRKDDPVAAEVCRTIQEWTIERLGDAFAAFFRRVKLGEKPGFPRFRSAARWNSFGIKDKRAVHLSNSDRLTVKGIPGSLRVSMHRPIPEGAKIGPCILRREAKGWTVCLCVELPAVEPRWLDRHVGIDLGLSTLAALSDGRMVENPRHTRRLASEVRTRARALSRCKRGSSGRRKAIRRLAATKAREANARATALHQASARVIRDYDLIAVEKLQIRNMVRSNFAAGISDAGWGKFVQMLAYKAEKAGARLIQVDPKNTSQMCSGCGVIVPKDLSVRVHDCPDCGLVLDRDVNAARNVLHKAIAGLGALNVASAACAQEHHGDIP